MASTTSATIIGELRPKQNLLDDMYNRGVINKTQYDSESKFLGDKYAKTIFRKDNHLLGNTSKESRIAYSNVVTQENTLTPSVDSNPRRSSSVYSNTQQANQSSTSIVTSNSNNRGSIPVLLDTTQQHGNSNVENGQYNPDNRL